MKPENAGRKQKKDTRFKRGQSGNPAGKPPGTRNKITMAAQTLLDGEGEALKKSCRDGVRRRYGGFKAVP